MRGPEEPRAVDDLPAHLQRLVAQSLAVEIEGVVAKASVRALEVARVCRRIAGELVRGRHRRADLVHTLAERFVRLDVGRRPAVPFAACGEDQVVRLAPDLHRRATDHVVGPRKPRHDEDGGCRARRGGASQALAAGPARDRGGQDGQRDREHEDRPHERDPAGERPGCGPPGPAARLRRTRVGVDARKGDGPGERLAEHERDVVLRPRVDGVEEAGEQRDALSPPPPHREHQEPRAEPEEQGLADEHWAVLEVSEHVPVPEERDVRGIAGRAEDLPLRLFPDALGNARAREVEPPGGEDVVEAGAQRCRVGAVAERVRGGEEVQLSVRTFGLTNGT